MIYSETLFKNTPQNFFSILSGTGKELNIECLIRLYDYIENQSESLKITKSEFDMIVEDIYMSEEHCSQETATERRRAFYNRVTKAGWLNTDHTKDGETTVVSLTPNARVQIRALKDITFPPKISMGEYIRTLYQTLQNIISDAKKENRKPKLYSMLCHAVEDIRCFSDGFTDIETTLKNKMKSMLKSGNSNSEDIFDRINEFLDSIIYGKINDLNNEGIDELSKKDIQDFIDEIRENDKIIDLMIEEVKIDYESPDYMRIRKDIFSKLDYIENQVCVTYEKRYSNLIETMTAYNMTMHRKMQMALNPTKENYIKLDTIIHDLDRMECDLDLKPLSLPVAKIMNQGNIYKPRSAPLKKIEEEPLEDCVMTITAEDFSSMQRKYSKENVERYFSEFLEENDVMDSIELPLYGKDGFNWIVSLFCCYEEYGDSLKIGFETTGIQETKGGLSYPGFSIRRKEKEYEKRAG